MSVYLYYFIYADRMREIHDQIEQIKQAYDQTVTNYNQGVSPEALLPDEFRNSPRYASLLKSLKDGSSKSDDPKVFNFLSPQVGQNFLDVGSCANLIQRGLDQRPSTYYGVDISPELIRVTQKHVDKHAIQIGGLTVADVASLPFEDGFFDI